MEEQSVQVETTKTVKGTLVFNPNLPTPRWATLVFWTEFWLNKFLVFWLTTTKVITHEQALGYIEQLAGFDAIIWAMAQSIGIKKPVTN